MTPSEANPESASLRLSQHNESTEVPIPLSPVDAITGNINKREHCSPFQAPDNNGEGETISPSAAALFEGATADELAIFESVSTTTGNELWVAHYRVLKLLGKGGMGMVLLAEDSQLLRPVALKLIRPSIVVDEIARMRFLREARSMASVKSDHVVKVHHIDVFNNAPFLAMEWLQGETLENVLRRVRKLPINQLLRYGVQLTKGLSAIHEQGLIHRDLKPANAWVEHPGDRIKILDFGLVYVISASATSSTVVETGARSRSPELTHTGHLLGTPGYMAPEQIRGKVVDHRCDLFSTGCILYRMVTGKQPFSGRTAEAVFESTLKDSLERVDGVDPFVPKDLANLIESLMAKDAAQRPHSAREVHDILVRMSSAHEKPFQATLPQAAANALPLPQIRHRCEPAKRWDASSFRRVLELVVKGILIVCAISVVVLLVAVFIGILFVFASRH